MPEKQKDVVRRMLKSINEGLIKSHPSDIIYQLSPWHVECIRRYNSTPSLMLVLYLFKDDKVTYADITCGTKIHLSNASKYVNELIKMGMVKLSDERAVSKARPTQAWTQTVKCFELTQFGRYVRKYHTPYTALELVVERDAKIRVLEEKIRRLSSS